MIYIIIGLSIGLLSYFLQTKIKQPILTDISDNTQEQEIVSYTSIKSFENEPFPEFDSQQQELEYIVKRLNDLGIKLNERLKIDDLKDTEFWYETQLEEKRGLDLAFYVFYMMCDVYEVRPSREHFPTSEGLFLFNYDWGGPVQYDQVLLNLIRMTKIKFDISDVENIFSHETQSAGLKFTFNRTKYEFILKYEYHAMDLGFFEKFKEVFNPYLNKNFYIVPHNHALVLYTDENTILKLGSFLNAKGAFTILV